MKYMVCFECKWIFEHSVICPRCGNNQCQTAHSLYGKKLYKLKETQEPYFNKKLSEFQLQALIDEINAKHEAEWKETKFKSNLRYRISKYINRDKSKHNS